MICHWSVYLSAKQYVLNHFNGKQNRTFLKRMEKNDIEIRETIRIINDNEKLHLIILIK